MISVTLPLRTVSEANAHTHWRVRQQRAQAQRTTAAFAVASFLQRPVTMIRTSFTGPNQWRTERAADSLAKGAVVTLTRISPRELDSDNLVGSQKHVRDGVADALGLDDRNPLIEWRYAQERGRPKEHAVRIEISPRPEKAREGVA